MTDEINHTERFIKAINSVYSDINSPNFIDILDNALLAEHDWVIRLNTRLEAANLHIADLEVQLKDSATESRKDDEMYDELVEFAESIAHGPIGTWWNDPIEVIKQEMDSAMRLLKKIDEVRK